ncbi:GGDEF domain-containing protein [Novosphingobium sp. H3SJ31-1]|uniref:GGDEF domain-containing protein n=1 Tax=Novosphingobium album (ex Liu et al. 2023) TaxID=3031130 RepID=A0ABT5WWZ6_9SPHN|nr:GGDEF domain-containing protein [Novosphingobium album (ex Liu et al. 2023)]
MGFEFTHQEGSALYGLVAAGTTDVILKTDREGRILHASTALEHLGFALPDTANAPHLLDLVAPASLAVVRAEHEAAVAGHESTDWVEFAARTNDGRQHWYAIRMRPLLNDARQAYGVLSIMRSLDERRDLEEQLFTAALTDPLTGLTNRPAFVWMLGHLLDTHARGSLALFDIDHFKAVNLRYGPSAGDEVLVAIAGFLRSLVRPQDIVSRVGGETFGVLLPDAPPDEAEAICRQIVTSLSRIGHKASGNDVWLTISSGLSAIAGTADGTIRRAELALFHAKAQGGNRLERDSEKRFPWMDKLR